MSIEDYAWASGFYEGEGNCNLRRSNGSARPIISIPQVNYEPIQKLIDIYNFGRVYLEERGGKSSPCYYWEVAKFDDVLYFAKSISPWLSEKRMIQIWDKIHYYYNWHEYKQKYCKNGHNRNIYGKRFLRLKANTKEKYETYYCYACAKKIKTESLIFKHGGNNGY